MARPLRIEYPGNVKGVKRGLSLLLPAILLVAVNPSQTQQVRYVYDDLGRLIAVIDQQGRMAIYEYDAVGNILAIRHTDARGSVGRPASW